MDTVMDTIVGTDGCIVRRFQVKKDRLSPLYHRILKYKDVNKKKYKNVKNNINSTCTNFRKHKRVGTKHTQQVTLSLKRETDSVQSCQNGVVQYSKLQRTSG